MKKIKKGLDIVVQKILKKDDKILITMVDELEALGYRFVLDTNGGLQKEKVYNNDTRRYEYHVLFKNGPTFLRYDRRTGKYTGRSQKG